MSKHIDNMVFYRAICFLAAVERKLPGGFSNLPNPLLARQINETVKQICTCTKQIKNAELALAIDHIVCDAIKTDTAISYLLDLVGILPVNFEPSKCESWSKIPILSSEVAQAIIDWNRYSRAVFLSQCYLNNCELPH